MTVDAPLAAAPAARPSPEIMRGVIPYIGFDGRAAEAADFYIQAFAAIDLGRIPVKDDPNRHMHIQVVVNGGALMMTDCSAPWEDGKPRHEGFHLQLVVGDADTWWERAVAAGCSVILPLERQFWGDRFGMLRDPFGIQWAINEPADQA